MVRYADAKRELNTLQTEYDAAVEALREFLYDMLPLDDADVLDWKYCGGKSISEIAEIRSLSYSGAANRIRRADIKAAKAYDLSRFEQEK